MARFSIDLWEADRNAASVLPNGLRVSTSNEAGRFGLRVYLPKATKPLVYEIHKSEESRSKRLDGVVTSYDAGQRQKLDARAARKGTPELVAAIDAGTIFEHSYGYDQTNISFYQVIARRGLVLEIRAIAQEIVPGSEGNMCEHVVPRKDCFIDNAPVLKKRLQFHAGKAFVSFDAGWCDLWDGKPAFQSHYA